MKTIQDYIVNEGFALAEAIKPPRLSAKNKHLWIPKHLDEEEVVKWLRINCSINYNVVTDDTIKHAVEIVSGRVNIKGDLAIRPFVEEIPFPFGKVGGIFDCEGCDKLKSLKNSPQRVVSYFDCSNCNDLTSLEGAPREVGGFFSCSQCNNLTSLEGAPEEVGGDFSCSQCNNLTSLKGAPEKVSRNFYCNNCGNLTSLKDAPKYIGGDFYCRNCSKQFTEEDVRKVCNVKGKIYV